jgi:hypothetical protein
MSLRHGWLALALLAWSLPGRAAELLAGGDASPRPYAVTEERAPCSAYDGLRQPFFGDTHVHTAYSFDASTQDTRNTPREAYRFARGEAIGIQPYDAAGVARRTVQLARPIDFAVVTDHAEMLGEVALCMNPDSPGYGSIYCKVHHRWPGVSFRALATRTLILKSRRGICPDSDPACRRAASGVWQAIRDAAEEAYDRSGECRFTSFVGYEWTAILEDGINLHRNVIFRNEQVPALPVSWVETPSAVDLWDHLEQECVRGIPGCDALTIPHNSNLSAGLMFESAALTEVSDAGAPYSADVARRRNRWEPLVEIMQHKGDSECALAVGAGGDEACGFESLAYDRFGPKFSRLARRRAPAASNYVRSALKQGLLLQTTLGANPFKYGIVASTDTHIAAPGLTAEQDHPGHGGAGVGAGEGIPQGFPDDFEFNPGGLAVVWAEENSRDSLFAAMQRREVYGTSGTRPRVRFFGGWDYPDALCAAPDFAAQGYAAGVPMGGDLGPRPATGAAPHFAVRAAQDPGSANSPGTPLQRIQIVKGWVEDGELRERVIDVAGGDNGAGVDTATCRRTGSGAATLCAVWSDPDFDPSLPAFYYGRVLENPSCRWSQYVCNAAGITCEAGAELPEGLQACCSAEHQPVLQERAWTSPIWYTP